MAHKVTDDKIDEANEIDPEIADAILYAGIFWDIFIRSEKQIHKRLAADSLNCNYEAMHYFTSLFPEYLADRLKVTMSKGLVNGDIVAEDVMEMHISPDFDRYNVFLVEQIYETQPKLNWISIYKYRPFKKTPIELEPLELFGEEIIDAAEYIIQPSKEEATIKDLDDLPIEEYVGGAHSTEYIVRIRPSNIRTSYICIEERVILRILIDEAIAYSDDLLKALFIEYIEPQISEYYMLNEIDEIQVATRIDEEWALVSEYFKQFPTIDHLAEVTSAFDDQKNVKWCIVCGRPSFNGDIKKKCKSCLTK